jgi:threonine synthase
MNQTNGFPTYRGSLRYLCLSCGATYPIDELYYTCPACGGVFLLEDTSFGALGDLHDGRGWQEIFDARAATKTNCLRGIFRFYELMAPVLEPEDIIYLGEGNTPIVRASKALESYVGQPLAYKNDGQNPSGSFKDRGMACAFSYLKHLVRKHGWEHVITICASTGDTSAAAALYASYVGDPLKSVVLLPKGKVTPQQLAQPLGSGALVLEVPGVFDDCMKVVEYLADNYRVALLNSKNGWRILGQESYAYEVAQWYDWQMAGKVVFVPIGNAGNVTAVMSGFLKLHRLGIIDTLPKIIGVQSSHADPVFKYYDQPVDSRTYAPVKVQSSVAQAAMIGNPVSFPRVKFLVDQYETRDGVFKVVQVQEQEIIEGMLRVNRHGHIACTQGGECFAGLLKAKEAGLLEPGELAILDSTAHALKFIGFQEMYFTDSFSRDYEIVPGSELCNAPQELIASSRKSALDESSFTREAAERVVARLGLASKDG